MLHWQEKAGSRNHVDGFGADSLLHCLNGLHIVILARNFTEEVQDRWHNDTVTQNTHNLMNMLVWVCYKCCGSTSRPVVWDTALKRWVLGPSSSVSLGWAPDVLHSVHVEMFRCECSSERNLKPPQTSTLDICANAHTHSTESYTSVCVCMRKLKHVFFFFIAWRGRDTPAVMAEVLMKRRYGLKLENSRIHAGERER